MDGQVILPPCPNCGAPLALEPYPPAHEAIRCGACMLRSPRFPRFAKRKQHDDSPRPKAREAVEWITRLEAMKGGGSDLVSTARRVIVAWDRQDANRLAVEVEAMRGHVQR